MKTALPFVLALLSCSRATAPIGPPPPESPAASTPGTGVGSGVGSGIGLAAPTPDPLPAIATPLAHALLFLPGDPPPPRCTEGTRVDQIHCLLAGRYASDPRAAALATALFDATGDIAGPAPPETMEGGFRGTLHLVPELPVGARRTHLEWVVAATKDFDDFFRGLAVGDDGGASGIRYRWRALGFRFMRSVGRTTPSAYANGWSITYNVDGSLNKSAAAVRELLFHEIFHLDDMDHGDWSTHALREIFDGIVARCHAKMVCLAPYAPTSTVVRGGTYYAFQPDNGDAVREYAAELALRYYTEQRAALRGERQGPAAPAFKCGPPENAKAWEALVAEFFGGIDRTGACK